MRWLTWLVLACGAATVRADANTPAILVLGDSLSAAYGIEQKDGWVALLQDKLTGQRYPHRVVNSSISGDTTRGGLQRLPADLARVQPAIVIVELGANDGLRGLPLRDMRDNLEQIVRISRAAGAQVLLIGMQLPPNYGPTFTRAFAQVYHDLASILNVPLVPFLLDGIGADKGAFLDDGLHPTASSQPRLVDNVWPALLPLLKTSR